MKASSFIIETEFCCGTLYNIAIDSDSGVGMRWLAEILSLHASRHMRQVY